MRTDFLTETEQQWRKKLKKKEKKEKKRKKKKKKTKKKKKKKKKKKSPLFVQKVEILTDDHDVLTVTQVEKKR